MSIRYGLAIYTADRASRDANACFVRHGHFVPASLGIYFGHTDRSALYFTVNVNKA